MNWLLWTLTSSIGKKILMAITGLIFCLFLAAHLLGNLSIYGGKSYFTAYAEHLHSFGILVNMAEIGLLVFAVLHISLGAILFYENFRARPVRYAMKKTAGGRTWSSALVPYTGLYVLIFVLIHLFTFHFVEHTPQTVFSLVANVFSKPGYVIFYMFSMVVVGLHVKHGFWSAFQTIGADHPKYTPIIQGASLVFSLAVAVGFASIPLFVLSST
jgi:succinate dehydrogenase / fumarate reductase cytochrome b subunit